MPDFDAVFESPLSDVERDSEGVDCLVIGSGTAGVTTAIALAGHGLRVVIVEAGPLTLTSHLANARLADLAGLASKLSDSMTIPTRWITSTESDAAQTAPVPVWVVVGGRTLVWTGTAPRYQPWDLDDWPIGIDEMSGYYDQAESLMRVSGTGEGGRPPFYDSTGQQAAIQQLAAAGLTARPAPVGVDTGADRGPGAGFDSSTSRLLACEHLGSFADGALLSLVTQAVVVELQLEGDRVGQVEVLDRRTGNRSFLRPRHVVLAGGSLQSARLALRSSLDARSPLVGRGVSDHLFVVGMAEFATVRADTEMNVMVDSTSTRPFHLLIQGPFAGNWDHRNSTMWVNCRSDGTQMIVGAFGVGSVRLDNRIVLSDDGDPEYGGMQSFRLIYDRTSEDEHRLAAMEEALHQAVNALGATLAMTQIIPPGGSLHEAGGLVMSAAAGSGVTDTHGRFWQVENLSAADASPFPSQGSANPYLTITAWSLRHADALARSLGAKSASAATAAQG